jgi:two-component system response regulator VicR
VTNNANLQNQAAPAAKVMLIDDEPSIQRLVGHIVEANGYRFCYADDGLAALAAIEREAPDLLLLDVMLPGMDGFHLCEILRARGYDIPIIILSAKGDIVDKGVGFSAGADDYMVKPFSPEELVYRIKAHLRRGEHLAANNETTVNACGIEIDLLRHRVAYKGEELLVTPKEYGILLYMTRHHGEVVTRDDLVREVWGEEFLGETSSVAVFIRKLREKLEADPSHPTLIQTVRNVGYRLGEC